MAQLAARQHGAVARRQLEALGLGRGAIAHRVEAGRLHRVHLGVYAVGYPLLTGHGRWMAAVLACGDGALLSHRSAAALWELPISATGPIDVTIIGRCHRGRPGITLHQPRHLHLSDRSIRHGIPVTSVARTILDLAEVASGRQLERALEEAERLRLFDLTAFEYLCKRSVGHRGLGRARSRLESFPDAVPDTRSELENRFVELCRNAGLPMPSLNVSVAGFVVDALWPAERLVVGLDGFAFHHTRQAFERDRARDAKLQLAGCRVLRITHRRLMREPGAVAAGIRQLLSCGSSPRSAGAP